MAKETPVERVQTQAIGTAISAVIATASTIPIGSGNARRVSSSAAE